MSERRFYTMNVGSRRARYLVNFHDGLSVHKDGSDFFDVRIFTNKVKMAGFCLALLNLGYKEVNHG